MKQVTLVGHYIADAVNSPASWIGAVLALFVKAMIPSPKIAASVLALVILCILDGATGALIAIKDHKFSVDVAGKGIYKIVAYSIAIAAISLMKLASPDTEMLWVFIASGVIGLFMAKETLSIMKHLEAFGIAIPKKLSRTLRAILKLGDEGTFIVPDPTAQKQKISDKGQ